MRFIKVKLKDICTPKQWKNLPISALHESGKYKVYGANGVIGYYNEYNHEFPTLAITCRGATCGNIHITEPKSYITSNAMSLDDLDITKVDLKFLKYVLLNRGFYDVITGSAQPQITATNLNKVDLLIPEELEEQQKIASLLSRIEGLINKREKSIKLLDELTKSTFLDMFLSSEDKKLFPLGSYIDFMTSGSRGWAQYYSETGAIFLRIQNVNNGNLFLDDIVRVKLPNKTEGTRTRVQENDLLISITADLGRTAVIPKDFEEAYINQHLALLRLKLDLINPVYLSHYFCTDFAKLQVQRYNKGGAKAGLNFTDIKKIHILTPSKPLQDKFAEIVTQIEQTKTIYQDSLKELNNLFGSIAQKAFKGELDVSKIHLDITKQKDANMTLKLTKDNLIQEIESGNFKIDSFINKYQHYYDVRDMLFEMLEDGLITQETCDVEEENPETGKIELSKKIKLACKIEE